MRVRFTAIDADSVARSRKREVKYLKPYEVWVKEKEEERRKLVEMQKINDEQTKMKEEIESEKRYELTEYSTLMFSKIT